MFFHTLLVVPCRCSKTLLRYRTLLSFVPFDASNNILLIIYRIMYSAGYYIVYIILIYYIYIYTIHIYTSQLVLYTYSFPFTRSLAPVHPKNEAFPVNSCGYLIEAVLFPAIHVALLGAMSTLAANSAAHRGWVSKVSILTATQPGYVNSWLLKIALIEIVDLPIQNGDVLYSYVTVYQRVKTVVHSSQHMSSSTNRKEVADILRDGWGSISPPLRVAQRCALRVVRVVR